MKTIILNVYKFLLLSVLLLFCWRCAESDLEIEREIIPDTELNLLSDKVTVQDLLRKDSPEKFKLATGKILNRTIGRRLLQKIKDKHSKGPFIYFYPILDKDGNLIITEYAEMRFWVYGQIDYNYKALHDLNNDELLFHEFFHIFQADNGSFAKSRNNEIEAYLAQYLYGKSKPNGNAPRVLDPLFSLMIGKLMEAIDPLTGDFLKGADIDQFYQNYYNALNYLEILPKYSSDDGWFSIKLDKHTHPFPNIAKLMKTK